MDRSDLADPWYEFRVCGAASARIGGFFHAEQPRGFEELATAGTVIVPACCNVHDAPAAELLEALRAAHERGARVVSICTGAFVLAAAGLLDGRRATTHWRHADLLAKRYPRVTVDPDVLYIDDGGVFTAAGKASGMDLCLHLVRLDHGAAVANALARRLVVPPHRDGGQAQFITTPVAGTGDHVLAGVWSWVLGRLDEPVTVAAMARQAHMSTRTLARHFHAATGLGPLQWLLSQRIRRAQELLETTDDGLDRIAARTGMGTATTLRRHFQRALGVSPGAYRRTFQATPDPAPAAVGPPAVSGAVA